MNRHRSNWSVMGAGLTGESSPPTIKSKEECKDILLKLFNTPHQHDQLVIICEALKEIKEELDF